MIKRAKNVCIQYKSECSNFLSIWNSTDRLRGTRRANRVGRGASAWRGCRWRSREWTGSACRRADLQGSRANHSDWAQQEDQCSSPFRRSASRACESAAIRGARRQASRRVDRQRFLWAQFPTPTRPITKISLKLLKRIKKINSVLVQCN